MINGVHSIGQKGQMWQEFQQLLAETKRVESKITTKEEIAARQQDKEIVERASTYTIESVVKELVDLQLVFDRTIDELTNQLSRESVKLDEVQKAISVETTVLQGLHHIEIAANALDILIQEHDAKNNAFEEQGAEWREAFTQQVTAQREAWQKEQEDHDKAVQEHKELLQNERSISEQDKSYDLERSRKIELDGYETKKRQIERTLSEQEREKEKEWATRENLLLNRQEELEEYKAQIDAFPAKLEKAIKESREQAIKSTNQSAKVKADLLTKEVEANKKVYELTIQTLEDTIERQNQEIQALSAELKEALKQVQQLASKAVTTPSVRSVNSNQ